MPNDELVILKVINKPTGKVPTEEEIEETCRQCNQKKSKTDSKASKQELKRMKKLGYLPIKLKGPMYMVQAKAIEYLIPNQTLN